MKQGSRHGGPASRVPEQSPFEREFPGSSESANACVMALVRTYEAWNRIANKALQHHQLSPAGRQALAVLDGADRPLSPTTVAERLLVTTASMTSLLDTLERRGFVTRSPDPDDRRKVLVTLTEDGKRVVDEFLPQVVAVQTALMADLTETQRRQLLESLATIRATIDTRDTAEVIAAAPPRGAPRRRGAPAIRRRRDHGDV